MHYAKAKDVGKVVLPAGKELTEKTLEVMQTVSRIVGNTLGPGGRPVLIERQEQGIPSFVTKDGVTVFKALSFDDPVKQEIMAAARDASIRTAVEAGDGTTTATVLAESIVRRTLDFCEKNPSVRPQKVVRRLEEIFRDFIEPEIDSKSFRASFDTEEGRAMLRAVAKTSANGDEALADVVMQCFDLVGDDGNVAIYEFSGPSKYEVEKMNGYPIYSGFEQSCDRFYGLFINDTANQRVILTKVQFLLYHGQINELQQIQKIIGAFGNRWQEDGTAPHNLVIIAQGFSESILGMLAVNFQHSDTINVFPLVIPTMPVQNGTMHFLQDVAAVTGATIFNPISNPIDTAELDDLGFPVDQFEAYRTRSSIIVEVEQRDESTLTQEEREIREIRESLILERVDELKTQMEQAESRLDRNFLEERLAKVTGGIAKLKIYGTSNSEQREKRDRAEDAVMAVRGAIKHGVLPAGGWMLAYLWVKLSNIFRHDPIIQEVLIPSLKAPVYRILSNIGLNDQEIDSIISQLESNVLNGESQIYDAWEGRFVNAFEAGLLDSTPAVKEAIRNSLLIAALLGTLGGAVVFKRDREVDLAEARSVEEFMRYTGMNQNH